MKRFGVMILVSFTGLVLLASGTSGTQSNPPTGDAFRATMTMKCVIVQLKAPNLVVLEDPKTGVKQPYRLASGIRLRAKHKQDFDGRKKITFQDLSIGQLVKVSILPEKQEVLTLKVIGAGGENS